MNLNIQKKEKMQKQFTLVGKIKNRISKKVRKVDRCKMKTYTVENFKIETIDNWGLFGTFDSPPTSNHHIEFENKQDLTLKIEKPKFFSGSKDDFQKTCLKTKDNTHLSSPHQNKELKSTNNLLKSLMNRKIDYFDRKKNECRMKNFCVKRKLKQLHLFLKTIYSFEKLSNEDVDMLNKSERKIFMFILKKKNYKYPLIDKKVETNDVLYKTNWNKIFKTRRKEECIKFSLKLIFKYLQQKFREKNKKLNLKIKREKMNLLFYLEYFYETIQKNSKQTLFENLTKNPKSLTNSFWSKISPFIIPEMGTQSSFSCVKSISKKFLCKISKSDKMDRDIIDVLFDLNKFMAYFTDHNWTIDMIKNGFNKSEKIGMLFVKMIVETNRTEISKLFTEWNNQIRIVQEKKAINTNDMFRIIIKTIDRKNFKFPWGFKEVQRSFVELLLLYLEVSRKQHIKGISSGKKKFI